MFVGTVTPKILMASEDIVYIMDFKGQMVKPRP